MTVYFVTHPEVEIDPAVPVTDWKLSPRGVSRMRVGAAQPWSRAVRHIHCSTERKAIDGAAILAAARGLGYAQDAGLGENDRSATGYLPRAEFEAVADEFFAAPERSVRGWERAVDAQARIVAAVERVTRAAPDGDVAIIAHGGVGALLLCHLAGETISRRADQPGDGGGNYFAFGRQSWGLRHRWRAIDG